MAKQKILIIEDDKSLVKLIKEALNSSYYDVIIAIDADEGCNKALLERPSLIILDILLPGKNGFDCLVQLKNNLKTKDIPVIILSNLGQNEEIREGLRLGAVDYLVKANFSIGEIVEKINKFLKK